MIAELGQFALALALVVAIAQSTIPLIGAARGDAALAAFARPAAFVQLACVVVAFAALTHAYVTHDFSVVNVARNSHSTMPLLYRLSGVWGNHEGSMLLWILILAAMSAAVASFGANLPEGLRARVLAVQGLIGAAFLTFTLFTSNPFARQFPPPLDGRELNPLLQDPGLAFHPPWLYLGYVGFSVAFSFAVAALIEGKVDPAWARWVRPWTLFAWLSLTVGIALGSWWAYYELGWGGWWFWDPVENASFMPWIVGAALLHSAVVVEKRDALKSWTILLALVAFSFSLIGTFLVRSGVLTSVHAFAVDPARGVFILMILLATIGGSLALFAWRAPALKSGGLFQPLSREGALVLNNLLLATGAATVLLGTLYPLFMDVLGAGKVSVGPPYFNATFVPLMVPLVIAMGIGPLLSWKRADLAGALARLRVAAIATVVVIAFVLYASGGSGFFAAAGLGLAAWLFVATLIELAGRLRLFRAPAAESLDRWRALPRSALGMTVAHAGMAIAIAGMTASTLFQEEKILAMRSGDTVAIRGYELRFQGVTQVPGPNYQADRARFMVTSGGSPVTVLSPERRFYPVQRQQTTEAAIHTTGLADLYVVVGDSDGKGAWTVRIYHNPLVPWIWAGCLIMALGGAMSLTDRRLRVGAPKRRPQPAE
ncbi:MAG: heme lyase CcmF/NrfE family subunit [Alphaproteobacteria bacterium]|nr:heme lyase CcmF/NrfE family subunit [Alphaproteobacteria bacterium]